ncbi:hypothetical protein VTK56DRAFT_615 [Thermocarpiscus australiensis]
MNEGRKHLYQRIQGHVMMREDSARWEIEEELDERLKGRRSKAGLRAVPSLRPNLHRRGLHAMSPVHFFLVQLAAAKGRLRGVMGLFRFRGLVEDLGLSTGLAFGAGEAPVSSGGLAETYLSFGFCWPVPIPPSIHQSASASVEGPQGPAEERRVVLRCRLGPGIHQR